MDTTILVSSGQALVKELDAADFGPRFAMWVHSTDHDSWKLWLVPPTATKDNNDKHEFYRRIAKVISDKRDVISEIDASDTELVADTHPAVKIIAKLFKIKSLGNIRLEGNTFDGFYIPDGIILRSNL